MATRCTSIFGTLAMAGSATLVAGAILVDLGALVDLLYIMSLGNALSAGAGLGLIFLPLGLMASRIGGSGWLAKAGAACLAVGICLASLVDVPASWTQRTLGRAERWVPSGWCRSRSGS